MIVEQGVKNYRLVPPNGGWGYTIVAATTIIFIATVVPLGVFGIIFENFLASKGDGTSGITLVTSTYNTVSLFMGLVANILLKKYSCRKVGLLGALIHFIGAIGTIFITKLVHLLFFYGIVEGIGFGLILPATLSAFNSYFDKKMSFMMSICQTIVVVGFMVIPQIGIWSMNTYGFRGSILLLAGLSAFCFLAAVALHPVKWHLKKEKNEDEQEKEINRPQDKFAEEPLVTQKKIMTECDNTKLKQRKRKVDIPLGERIGSLASMNNEFETDYKNTSFFQSFINSMDLHLLKDIKYLNISVGLSLSFTADVAFYPIIPPIMKNIGFTSPEIALMMSVFFGSDLAARITLSVISAFFRIRSRYLILGAAIASGIFRIALFFNDTLKWKLVVLAVLGYSRCFIQTPQALVISEDYPDKFATAYSLYMAINGVVCLVFGQLMSLIKYTTQSDFWACHILTTAFFANAVCWSLEMFRCGEKKRENNTPNIQTLN